MSSSSAATDELAVGLVHLDVATVGPAQHHAQRGVGEGQAEALLGVAAGQGLGDDAGGRAEHGDVVVAPDALALDQVEADEADEAALVGQRHGEHRADALGLEQVDLVAPLLAEVGDPGDVDDLEPLEGAHPLGEVARAATARSDVDLAGHAGGGPLVGVLDDAAGRRGHTNT